MSLLSDEEEWKLWNAQGIDDMNQAEAIAFARAYAAAILAKLGSAELPEPAVQRTKESKEKTLDDWFYASNPAYAKVHSSWKWEGLFTAAQLHEAHAQGCAQGAAAQLAEKPSAFTDADYMSIFVSKDIAIDCGATIELYTRREA